MADDLDDDGGINCSVDERYELPQNTDQQIEQNEPKIGMEFNDPDELFEFYRDYAKSSGFPVKKHTRRKNVIGIVRSITLVCGRAGKHNSTCQNPLKPQTSYKVGCNAKITARLNLDGRWEISVVVLEHNHGLSPTKSRFFRCNRRISAHVRHQINLNDQAGIRMNKNFSSLVHEAGGYENMLCDEKACRNLVDESRRLRLGEGDASAIMKYFSRMVAENSDGRSREAYKEFGEVVTFDTTYLTNKYDMPFAPFVGVNHHGQSILLGCGLISKEDTETFIWLFTKWVECMDGCAPQGIITDQARAMKNAIEIVFPNTRHRWCLWHIMKKLSEKLGRYTEYEAISSTMKGVVYDTQSPQEFEIQWNEMVDMYGLEDCDWLCELYEERNRWVPCFVKNCFWAGMSTTQRSESMNAFFDGYVNSKTSLKQFVEQYENALRNKTEKEMRADAESFSKVKATATTYDMESQIQGVYTLAKFKEFQAEFTGKMYCDIVNFQEGAGVLEYVIRDMTLRLEGGKRIPKFFKVSFRETDSEVECSCQLFVFKGIVCRHALTILIRHDVSFLLEKYILQRWRKDVRRAHSKMKVKFNTWVVTPEQLRYHELCLAFSEVADLAAQNNHECEVVKKWIDTKFRELQLAESS
ncbi:protein FAR-RED IMPAIRED RESPONSE 1-like [Asparagus officinalis]|uniref:protein FAR-RED IMPAIRED RESPONSE 1-like n=1 Tax=Asparagus officinalis TaxID=4686 RepID=UPI00098E5BFC|nr:protein FAR-RED IMPAIRED RESPONSE 1-like [Asparagus officinalis]